MTNLFEMIGASFIFVIGMMSFLWVIYYFQRHSTIVDVGWAAGFIVTVWISTLLGLGYPLRKWLMTAMVSIWAGRLGWHLFKRYQLNEEDPRYREIRGSWGEKNIDFKFFLMFLFQGFLVILLSVPFAIVCRNPLASWNAWEAWGFFVWLVGFCGEFLADYQLEKFKRNPDNRGKVCQQGLWYVSRHPNYFFEWIVWVGYFIFAMGSPWGIVGVISPLVIFLLLTKVSGIPLLEQHALDSRGEAYREYQCTTNAFFPWFKKQRG